MKLFSVLLILDLCSFSNLSTADTICDKIDKNPGLYLSLKNEQFMQLPLSKSIDFDSGLKFYFVAPKPANQNESVWHIRLQTIAIEKIDSTTTIKLVRNPVVKSKCEQRDVGVPEHDLDSGNFLTTIKNHDDFASGRDRTNINLQSWHFNWKVSPQKCSYTANFMEQFKYPDDAPYINGQKFASIFRTKEANATEIGQTVSRTTSFRKSLADITFVLVHSTDSDRCYSFKIPDNKQFWGLFTKWKAQETRIQYWQMKGKHEKINFTLKWQ